MFVLPTLQNYKAKKIVKFYIAVMKYNMYDNINII